MESKKEGALMGGHGYRRNAKTIPVKKKPENTIRRIEVAFMRLDRLYCARMMMYLVAALILIMSFWVAIGIYVALGYIRIMWLGG